MYSKAYVELEDGTRHHVLNFGPVSVIPERKNQGIGSALMKHSLKIGKTLGYGAVIFFGHATYYPRFGFKEAKEFGITTSLGDNYPSFMAMELIEGDGITLKLREVLDYPNRGSIDGGHYIECSIEITCSCYKVMSNSYGSSTGALYTFQKELEDCYDNLNGKAKYALLLENDLVFEVVMGTGGRALIQGKFQEFPDKDTSLSFEFETDQSCFLSVIRGIEALKTN